MGDIVEITIDAESILESPIRVRSSTLLAARFMTEKMG